MIRTTATLNTSSFAVGHEVDGPWCVLSRKSHGVLFSHQAVQRLVCFLRRKFTSPCIRLQPGLRRCSVQDWGHRSECCISLAPQFQVDDTMLYPSWCKCLVGVWLGKVAMLKISRKKTASGARAKVQNHTNELLIHTHCTPQSIFFNFHLVSRWIFAQNIGNASYVEFLSSLDDIV